MATETKASPRPWKRVGPGPGYGNNVAIRDAEDFAIVPAAFTVSGRVEAFDLIVRAVNEHEALVEALRECVRELECVDESPFGHRCNRCDSEVDPNGAARKKASAILARIDVATEGEG